MDDIDIHASLTLPTSPDLIPAVIMVAGSSPTDCVWNYPLIPGVNGSAALLSQVLAMQGPIVYPMSANHVLKHEPCERSQMTAAEVTAAYNAEGSTLPDEGLNLFTT